MWPSVYRNGINADYVRALLRLQRLEEAESVCQELLDMLPEDGNVHWAAGLLALHKNDAAAAIRYSNGP